LPKIVLIAYIMYTINNWWQANPRSDWR